MVRLVEPAELVQQAVVAEHLAVIAREDDERVVRLPGLVEPIEQASDVVVDLGEHPVVRRLQLALLLRIVGRLQERMVDHHAEQRMLRALVGPRRRAHRRRNRRRIEHRVVRRGREERRMRPQERQVREPRVPVAPSAHVDELLGEERGLRMLRVVLRAPRRALGRTVDERAPLVGHVDALLAHPCRATRAARPRAGGTPDRSRAARLRSESSRGSSGATVRGSTLVSV